MSAPIGHNQIINQFCIFIPSNHKDFQKTTIMPKKQNFWLVPTPTPIKCYVWKHYHTSLSPSQSAITIYINLKTTSLLTPKPPIWMGYGIDSQLTKWNLVSPPQTTPRKYGPEIPIPQQSDRSGLIFPPLFFWCGISHKLIWKTHNWDLFENFWKYVFIFKFAWLNLQLSP